MSKSYLLTAALFSAIMISMTGCSDHHDQGKTGPSADSSTVVSDNKQAAVPGEGDLCSVVKDSTGRSFGVVKILKIEGDTFHLRTYGVSYDKRPVENDLQDIKPNSPAGIGHLPLSREQFERWKPEVIINQPVSLEELEGYNTWKSRQK